MNTTLDLILLSRSIYTRCVCLCITLIYCCTWNANSKSRKESTYIILGINRYYPFILTTHYVKSTTFPDQRQISTLRFVKCLCYTSIHDINPTWLLTLIRLCPNTVQTYQVWNLSYAHSFICLFIFLAKPSTFFLYMY